VSFLFTADFERYQWRYRHSRALRNILMDLASLAHRLILATTALEHDNFLSPAIADQEAEELLNIDHREFEEAALYVVSVGE
jgi:nitroreductase